MTTREQWQCVSYYLHTFTNVKGGSVVRAVIVCGILKSRLCVFVSVCVCVPTLSSREVNDGNLREEE